VRVGYWNRRIDQLDKKGAQMMLKWGPNRRKRGPNWLKQGQCYMSFGLNGSHFCRNSSVAKQLPLWALGAVIKPCASKELRTIMVCRLPSSFHKSQIGLSLRRSEFLAQNRLCITNYNSPSLSPLSTDFSLASDRPASIIAAGPSATSRSTPFGVLP
jgi:hypothetical protein